MLRRIVNTSTKQVEENISEKYCTQVKGLKTIVNQRYNLFRSILFSVIKRHVTRLRSNTNTEPEVVKTLMALHNNMVHEINSKFSYNKFKDFVLEETKNKPLDNIFQKAPYAHLVNKLQNPMVIKDSNYGKPCKPLVGLPCFVVCHNTKTKKELSVNVLSDTYTAANSIQFKDISALVFSKNSFLKDELEYLVKYHLKDSYDEFAAEKKESDIFFGFIGTIVISSDEDLYESLDMLYYPEKNYTPTLKLFYSVFQYKKEGSVYAYEEIEPFDNLNHISLVESKPYSIVFEDKPCLFLKSGEISLRIQNGVSAKLKQFYSKDGQFQIDVNGRIITPNSKQILYDYITPNDILILYNKNRILSKFMVYDIEKLYKNDIFTFIRERFILSNNKIVKEIDASDEMGLDTFYRLTSNSIPWDKLHDFYLVTKEADMVKLLQAFKEHSPEDHDNIVERLLTSSLLSIYDDLYIVDNERKQRLLVLLETDTDIEDCVLNASDEIENLCPEFFYILKTIFKIIKTNA